MGIKYLSTKFALTSLGATIAGVGLGSKLHDDKQIDAELTALRSPGIAAEATAKISEKIKDTYTDAEASAAAAAAGLVMSGAVVGSAWTEKTSKKEQATPGPGSER